VATDIGITSPEDAIWPIVAVVALTRESAETAVSAMMATKAETARLPTRIKDGADLAVDRIGIAMTAPIDQLKGDLEKKIPGIIRKATDDLTNYADGKKKEIVDGWRTALIAAAGNNADSIRAQAKTDGMRIALGIALISLLIGMGITYLIFKAAGKI
ncbi:MAG: hypothetical protein ACYDBP_14945, partial [Leptospirales bacterium]